MKLSDLKYITQQDIDESHINITSADMYRECREYNSHALAMRRRKWRFLRDFYGMMLASGISIMIGVQVCINIAVVTSSMPPTGVILPFVSYGGNALMLLMGLMGILWNVTKQSEKKEIRLLAEQEKRTLEEERQRMIRRTVRQR